MLLFGLSIFLLHAAVAIDPSLFFTGAKPRPKLEITHPENGQILTGSELEIILAISGFEHPSSLFGSSICIGLSSSISSSEKCFEQTSEVIFHVGGLAADTHYSLRVVLFERDRAIAVSIRSFHVAGIRGFFGEQVVTIKTAVQVALQYQQNGDTAQAEKIYRSVLSVVPLYPDALHLLGLVFHQQGATETAISYIEKALEAPSKSFEGYHNSLGECYRVLGRIADAENQFEKALALNPTYHASTFNLGLVHQQAGRSEKALALFRKVGESMESGEEMHELRLKSKIRECDLVNLLGKDGEAISCWKDGVIKYPDRDVFYNELGSVYLSPGHLNYDEALRYFSVAASAGNILAGTNQAHVLETLDRFETSVEAYKALIKSTDAQGLPVFHMKIKMATLLPRIIPHSEKLDEIRFNMEVMLRALLMEKDVAVDNAPASDYGFSTGFFLIAHGVNNLRIKMVLARLYIRFCPALLTGNFVAKNANATIVKENAEASRKFSENDRLFTELDNASNEEVSPLAVAPLKVETTEVMEPASSPSVTTHSTSVAGFRKPSGLLKVGFASRFFFHHAVGILAHGLIKMLAHSGCEVIVFMIDGLKQNRDAVTQDIIDSAHGVYAVNTDLSISVRLIREAQLDILIFPELGIDPVAYFLSFSHLAKVQVVLPGFPDTSGVPSADLYITSLVDAPNPTKFHSEKLYRMHGLGVPFVDIHREYNELLLYSPKVVAAEKAVFLANLQLPQKTHIYGIAETLHFLHPHFDMVLHRILSQDHLAHILFLDAFNSSAIRTNYQARLAASWNDSFAALKHRYTIYTPKSETDILLAMSCIHVLLDPFPVSSYFNNLQALSLGVPVITFPTEKLAGKQCLALYSMIEYQLDDLIVKSDTEYIKSALAIAHSKTLRAQHSDELVRRRYLFYDETVAAEDWKAFFESNDVQVLLKQ